jgi:predicted  nucleic acid-binding Zn-ribbon protein
LASQLRLELNDLEKEIFRLEGELAAAKSDRSEFEEMVLNARLAKLETEKELADYRQKMAEQEEEILRLKEDMSVATSERENAEDRTIRLSERDVMR